MIKERTELTNDEIIEAYLKSCKRRVNDIKDGNYKRVVEKQEVKKKSNTKIKKLYPIYSKIALSLGLIIAFGLSELALFWLRASRLSFLGSDSSAKRLE